MSSLQGYRSPVNLPLGQTPLTGDPELFEEFSDVYNSIHLINQYLDQLRIIAEGGGSGQTPAETLPFNRFFVTLALQDISAGMPVSPSPRAGENGVIKGALADNYTNGTPYSHFCGIAITDATAGQNIRVGVGPAVLAVPGALSGGYVWAYAGLATNGNQFGDGGLYIGNPGVKTVAGNTCYPMPVASVLQNGYALFGQFLLR